MIRDREVMNVDESSLEFVSVLGRGGFGSVSLMRDSNFRFYAEKSSPLNHLKNLEKEHRIMLRFRNHPRIVQTSSPHLHIGIKPERCYIFMEFASKGTLHTMISEFRGRPMPETMIGRAALMILQGIEALHSHGYVHCDLKPANVLLFPSKTFGEPWYLKLADFGLSKEPCTDSRSLFAGTKQYMPPESFGPNGAMRPAVDICLEDVQRRWEICYTWRLPRLVSPMANDFLRRCLELQPSRRATAAELLNHPFVAQRMISVPLRTEIPSFLRFPSVIRNNVMEEYSKRQGGRLVMKMVPRPEYLIC